MGFNKTVQIFSNRKVYSVLAFYMLSERSCADVNECELNTTCQNSTQPSPYCVNTIGSFSCVCDKGKSSL